MILSALFCLFLSLSIPIKAETLKLVTGEYAPYAGEKLVNGGVGTEVVRAAFKEMNIDVTIEFNPWNRAMNALKASSFAGSFPWKKNAEREELLLYSEPLHEYQVTTYIKKSESGKAFDLTEKILCEPSGWDIAPFNELIKKHKLQLVRPIEMESCFRMLALGRVDVVIGNIHVCSEIIKKLHADQSPFTIIPNQDLEKVGHLYFVVPKKHPNAHRIVDMFNRGLEIIKKNGKYEKIMNQISIKSAFKSNCVLCSRLGSL